MDCSPKLAVWAALVGDGLGLLGAVALGIPACIAAWIAVRTENLTTHDVVVNAPNHTSRVTKMIAALQKRLGKHAQKFFWAVVAGAVSSGFSYIAAFISKIYAPPLCV